MYVYQNTNKLKFRTDDDDDDDTNIITIER